MKTILRGIIVVLCLSFGASRGALAQEPKKSKDPRNFGRSNRTLTTEERGKILRNRLTKLKRDYRRGIINSRAFWDALADLHMRGSQLTDVDRISLLQTQSVLLNEAGYPVTAAIYASQAINLSNRPTDRILAPAWSILRRVSMNRPIQNLLDTVADKLKLQGKVVPEFESEWNYFYANAKARSGALDEALKLYEKVESNDRYFIPSRYQQAMIYVEQNKLHLAEKPLKIIVDVSTKKKSSLPDSNLRSLVDYALMALGRIYYEQERFLDSIKVYRAVDRDGANFYDALFEQSWSFFMGGYPMHALGALYAVESPFYDKVFNPEAPLVRALINYWLCRYQDSRSALADFSGNYADTVEKLEEFLEQKHLDSETAYQLFENMLSGVSGESLEIPLSVLKTAAEKDSMMLVRDQYASILEEKRRLETKGVFGSYRGSKKPLEYMDRWALALRKDIGQRYLAELIDIKKEYQRLYAQAEFLYVELLMSEKEQILGKELHASSKITRVSKRMKIAGWADTTQAWKASKIGEYWWDELGYYISPVDSQCQIVRRN